MAAYPAILFDFDGVLVDSEPLHFACWREILAEFDVPLDWQTYCRHCVGVADRAMIEVLCRLASPPAPFEQLWAQYPRKKEMFRWRMLAELPFPAANLDLVRSLSGSCSLAVVSSSGRREVEPILVAAGIREAFQALVCAEDVTNLKPAPDPYLLAAHLLGVERALVVEDSEAGVASGRAAGFDVLRVGGAEEMAVLLRRRLAETGE